MLGSKPYPQGGSGVLRGPLPGTEMRFPPDSFNGKKQVRSILHF